MVSTEIGKPSDYETQIAEWRQILEDRLRADDGWLTLTGLYWLNKGENSIGSDPNSDILLPNSVSTQLGTLNYDGSAVNLTVTCDEQVLIDGVPVKTALLRDENAEGGATNVVIGSVTFFVIRRGGQYGVRVRDKNNPLRQSFTGRKWFPVDNAYRVTATFVPHDSPRTIDVMSSAGVLTPMENPGSVTFTMNETPLSLEAFASEKDELWFIFKDKTNGVSTYGAGRFLKARLSPEGLVDLDFNRAYSPPCAFTDYATCPLPPKENVLPLEIPAGERYKD
jgi:uncharacterized protein (DUF1684 family)